LADALERPVDYRRFRGNLLRYGSLASFLEDSGRMEVVLQGLPAEAEALRPYLEYRSGPSENGVHFVVPVHLQRELIEHAWAAGGTLKSVTPLRRTLEDLFITWSGKDGA